MKTHPFTLLNLVTEVDDNMVPVVNWLNSFENTRTLGCCEGDFLDDEVDDGLNKQPFVIFVCDSADSLKEILSTYNRAARLGQICTEIQWFFDQRYRYITRWAEKEDLLDFNTWLGKEGIEDVYTEDEAVGDISTK